MALLAEEVIGCWAEQLTGGMGGANFCHILKHLADGQPILVPYPSECVITFIGFIYTQWPVYYICCSWLMQRTCPSKQWIIWLQPNTSSTQRRGRDPLILQLGGTAEDAWCKGFRTWCDCQSQTWWFQHFRNGHPCGIFTRHIVYSLPWMVRNTHKIFQPGQLCVWKCLFNGRDQGRMARPTKDYRKNNKTKNNLYHNNNATFFLIPVEKFSFCLPRLVLHEVQTHTGESRLGSRGQPHAAVPWSVMPELGSNQWPSDHQHRALACRLMLSNT